MSKSPDIQQSIQDIYDRLGHVQPSTVIEEARPQTSPLHDSFEWRDDVAGHEYRLIQARTLIRRVKIRVVDSVHDQHVVHVKRADSSKGEGKYYPVSTVAKDDRMFAIALEEAENRLASAKRAVKMLMDASRSETDVDQVRRSSIALAIKSIKTATEAIRAVH